MYSYRLLNYVPTATLTNQRDLARLRVHNRLWMKSLARKNTGYSGAMQYASRSKHHVARVFLEPNAPMRSTVRTTSEIGSHVAMFASDVNDPAPPESTERLALGHNRSVRVVRAMSVVDAQRTVRNR